MVQEAYASYSAMQMHLWEGIRSGQLVTMVAQTPILIARCRHHLTRRKAMRTVMDTRLCAFHDHVIAPESIVAFVHDELFAGFVPDSCRVVNSACWNRWVECY
jgi:hypothetical protein